MRPCASETSLSTRAVTTPDCFSRSLRTDFTWRSNWRRFCLTDRCTVVRRWRRSRSHLARGRATTLVALDLALQAGTGAVLAGQALDRRDQVVAGHEAGSNGHEHDA